MQVTSSMSSGTIGITLIYRNSSGWETRSIPTAALKSSDWSRTSTPAAPSSYKGPIHGVCMATATLVDGKRNGHHVGKIVQVIGSTFDAEFDEGHLPEIYNACKVDAEYKGVP